jgi:sugar (pentulose or hexulose) kinase
VWWSSLVQAVHGLQESGVSADEIAGISIDATAATVLALDESGRHLRPAIMWMDVRASEQATRVSETGTMALITGSSHVMIGQSATPIHGHRFWGSYTDAIIPGQYTAEAGQVSTGSIVAWFKDNFAADVVAEGERRGVDPYVILTEKAQQVPIGSDGLVVLDYFQGNRTPHTDPYVRGQISGLSLGHGQGHVFRAIIEGICYGTEDIFRTMRVREFEPKLTVVSGGPAKSDLWMQMHADVSNVPISLTRVSEGPVLDAAMPAAGRGDLPRHPDGSAEHGPHGAHDRARPGARRGVRVLFGALHRDVSGGQGRDAQDGPPRRRDRGGGRRARGAGVGRWA